MQNRGRKAGGLQVPRDPFCDMDGPMPPAGAAERYGDVGLAAFGIARQQRDEQILDPAELDFPFDRPTMFNGLEAFPELLADPISVRKAYREEIEAFVNDLRSQSLANQMDFVQIRSDQPFDAVLRNFFNHRNARLV